MEAVAKKDLVATLNTKLGVPLGQGDRLAAGCRFSQEVASWVREPSGDWSERRRFTVPEGFEGSSLGSVVLVDGADEAWIIDFGFSEVAADDRLLAADVAQLIAALSLSAEPERVVAVAVEVMGAAAVSAAHAMASTMSSRATSLRRYSASQAA